jgi:hypothetical protein
MSIIDDARDWQQAIQRSGGSSVSSSQTAALQHGNDQKGYWRLMAAKTGALADLAAWNRRLIWTKHDIAALAITLTASSAARHLQSTVTYPDLEWAQFGAELKPDAASGRGTATFTPADTEEPSVFPSFRMLRWLATKTTISTCTRLASSSRTLRIGTLHSPVSGIFQPTLT